MRVHCILQYLQSRIAPPFSYKYMIKFLKIAAIFVTPGLSWVSVAYIIAILTMRGMGNPQESREWP